MEEDQTLCSIINHINCGIIESNIEYVKRQDSSVCLAKVALKINYNDSYACKELFAFLHEQSEYSPILVNKEEAVILIFRDCKIFQAKATMQKIQRFAFHLFNVDLSVVGMTLIDHEDDIKSLSLRLEKQYMRSRDSAKPKICYDTKYFDISGGDNIKSLESIFKKQNIVKIHNLYEGVPVVDQVAIKQFEDGNLVLKIDKSRIAFFLRENFCFIEHELIANIIRANILRVNQSSNSLVLNELELVESSPVERSGIRVVPPRKIFASLLYENKDIGKGFIVNLSENSIVIKLNKSQINYINNADLSKKYLSLIFQIPTSKDYITTVKTKATIFRTEDDLAIVSIFPGAIAKKKIRIYISMLQTNLLSDLKTKLKETQKFILP